MYSSVPVVFLQKFIAHGGVSLYIITRVLTRNEQCYTVKVGITEETEETT